IIDDISQLTEEHGEVIAFEDDISTYPFPLKYSNQTERKHKDKHRVMQISAYMSSLKDAESMPNTFFFRATSSWGWATWKRAWDKFKPDVDVLYTQFDKQKTKDFSVEGKMNYWKQLLDFKNNKNNSWAIRWYASVFLNNGLVLYPSKSLVEIIGHDGTGVHSNMEDIYQVTISREPIEK